MLINRNKHRVELPGNLNSHQVVVASRFIHDKVQGVVTPLLDSKPQYHAVRLILEKVDLAIGQLKTAHDRRKYKGPKDQRATGTQDGKFQYETASEMKKQLYRTRKSQLKRFRIMIDWQHNTAEINLLQNDLENPLQIAGKRLAEILLKRPDRFEDLSYSESLAETQYMIDDIEGDTEALAAIDQIGVTAVYDSIKALQSRFTSIHDEQADGNAAREELPTVTESTRDLRHLVNKLLSLLQFDVETEDQTFLEVLSQVDEILDKEHATAARRITLAKKEAAQKEAQKQADNQQPASDASGTSGASGASDANAPADGEPPADGGTGGSSGGVSQDQDPDAAQSADQVTDQNDAQTADADSDSQQQEVTAA